MTRIPVAGAEAGGDILPLAISHASELREGRDGILFRVDGRHRLSPAAAVAAVELIDLHLLDVAGVRQHDGGKIGRSGRRVDRSVEAGLHELRHEAAVVDMGVGEAKSAEAGGPKREVLIIELPLLLRPLEHAAIDQDAGCFRFEHEAGARHGSGGAVEVEAKRQAASFQGERTWAARDRTLGSTLRRVTKVRSVINHAGGRAMASTLNTITLALLQPEASAPSPARPMSSHDVRSCSIICIPPSRSGSGRITRRCRRCPDQPRGGGSLPHAARGGASAPGTRRT